MYLSEQDKQQLAEWRMRWRENGPEIQELRKLMRETRRIALDNKCGKTTASAKGKVYTYGAHEVSLDAMKAQYGLELVSPGYVYDGIETQIRNVALYRALRTLSQEERAIIGMIFFRGMTETEVGKKLGVSQMTVNRRKRRALRKMRDYLERCEDEVEAS